MNFLVRVAVPALIAALAACVRLFSWHSVFQDNGVYPNGNDAYYHLRRIRYSVENFPEVLGFDPLMNFPAGAQPIWPPSFDWLIAALLRVLPAIDQPDQLERYAAYIPPILGVLTVLVVYYIGLHFFSRVVGVVAAVAMAILPAHSIYSRIGAVDHHVLVAFLVAVMLALAMAVTGAEAKNPDGRRAKFGIGRVRLCVGLGLSMASAILIWPGSLLQVGVLQVALVLRMLSEKDASSAGLWARRFALVHFVAFLAVVPLCVGNTWQIWGPFSPVVLTGFQPIYFLAGSVCFGVLGGLWHFAWGAGTRRARILSACLTGLGLGAGILLVVPEILQGLAEALSWFAKGEEFQSAVNESVGLFAGARGSARAVTFLSRFVYLVPLAFVYFAWQFRARADALLLLGWGVGLFVATLVQWRFMNSYSIAHCLLIGWVADSGYRGLRAQLGSPIRKPLAALVSSVVAVGVVVLFAPSLQSYRLHRDNFSRSHRGEPTIPVGAQRHARAIVDAARFLKAHSPGERLPSGIPQYSVLGPWGDGHIIKTIAERAVVQDNFGDDVAPENFLRAEEYFAARTESAALEILAPMKTRYVLVRSTGSGHSKGYDLESMFSRLYRLRGHAGSLTSRSSRGAKIEMPLTHHRLIYQSSPLRVADSKPYVMIFEIVAGAELVGNAVPQSIVEVRLKIAPKNGLGFFYSASAETNAEGVYRLRLPYSNESSSPNVRIGHDYRVRVGAQGADVSIPEWAVLSGAQIDGPTFED